MFLIVLSFLFLFLIPITQSGTLLGAFPTCAAACVIPFSPLCIACIGSMCIIAPVASACFSEDTKIVKLENGQTEEVYIGDIKRNDIVLSNDLNKYTKVVKNVKSEGIFNYTQIILESGKALTVTNEHGVIILDNKSNKKIIKASSLKEGQMLITLQGPKIIKDVKHLSIKNKYILETQDGTVIANNIYVSTICDDMIDEKMNSDDLIKLWKEKHSYLYNKILNN